MTPEADSAEAFFEASPAAIGNSGAPALRLGAYEGPLDLLLELARAQLVDLAQISIATLAEQFEAVVAAAIEGRAVSLPRMADWLIMAAWLTLLRSRLLLPAAAAESVEANREAEGLRRRVADREWASRLADWLERRPQLGRTVFARGWVEADPAEAAAPYHWRMWRSCCVPACACWSSRIGTGCTGRGRRRFGGCRMRSSG